MMKKLDTPLFELKNSKNLFEKAKRDYESFEKFRTSEDLFNFICTINHLHDWVKNEAKEKDDEINTPFDKEPHKKDKNKKLTYPADILHLIRYMCNRAKHFKRKENSPSTFIKEG